MLKVMFLALVVGSIADIPNSDLACNLGVTASFAYLEVSRPRGGGGGPGRAVPSGIAVTFIAEGMTFATRVVLLPISPAAE
jgi:hypothetical protein